MLDNQSLKEAVDIAKYIVSYKETNPKIDNALYNQIIKPKLEEYKINNRDSANNLFKGQLIQIDELKLFNSETFSFKGRYVNSHTWATLYIKGLNAYTSPQLYILANSDGIKYGFDYGSQVKENNIYVDKVRNSKGIQDEILRILNSNSELKLYSSSPGSPDTPDSISSLEINSKEDIVSNWNNAVLLIGVIRYDDINLGNSGNIIFENLKLLYKLYQMISFENTDVIETQNIVEEENVKQISVPPPSPPVFINRGFNIDLVSYGNLNFKYKNIILKGVPGTGKSRLLDIIIAKELSLNSSRDNVLRINIHSASTNADLMRGIGISTNENHDIEYHEKRGLILNQLSKAIQSPLQPFVIILEEIQESSLNALIGDLIYLIEDEKRADIAKLIRNYGISNLYQDETEFINQITSFPEIHYVIVPYLVLDETKYRKMVLPSNLYIFCTSNYRDDKKIIEDNLLRRFEVIELYPRHEIIEEKEVGEFLKELNDSIHTKLKDIEIHPDRFKIGHSIWLKVKTQEDFFKSFLKVVIEFQDIKELEFKDFSEIINNINSWPFQIQKSTIILDSYSELIVYLQNKVYQSFIND